MIDHRVVVRRLPASGLSQAFLLVCVNKCMCVKFTHTKNGLSSLSTRPDEILGLLRELVVASQHPLLVERPGVLDLLLADLAPARLHGRVVDVGREAVDDAARPDRLEKLAEFLLWEVVDISGSSSALR